MATASNKYTIIIQNLHPNATKEIIFLELKNQDLTPEKITISKPKGNFCQAFIGYRSKEKQEEAFEKLQFIEILGQQITCSLYQENEGEKSKYKVFLKNISKEADPKQIFRLWTQFGKMQSINIFLNSQGKPLGAGTIQFSNEQEVQKCLDNYKQCIQDKEHLKDITVEKFEKSTVKKSNGIVIRNIKLDPKTISEVTSEKLGALATEQVEKIKNAFKKYDIAIKTASFTFPAEKEKPSKAMILIENTKQIQGIIEQYDRKEGDIFKILEDIGYNKDVEIIPIEDPYSDYQAIYMKNIAPPAEDKDESDLKQELKEAIEKYGEVTDINIAKGQKPPSTDKQYADSYSAQVFTKRGKNGLEFIKKYQTNSEFKKLFIKNTPYVTILLNQKNRKQMKNNFLTYQKNESTTQQAVSLQQVNHAAPGPRPMMANMFLQQAYNKRIQQQPRPFQQQNRPQQQMQQQNKPQQQQQQQQVPQQQQQQQQAPQQQYSKIEEINANLQTFLSLEKNLQFQHLGLLMFPKVKEELLKLPNIQDPASFAQKITGMMVDLTVFEVSEIIETLENPSEFKERLDEAIELIQSQEKK